MSETDWLNKFIDEPDLIYKLEDPLSPDQAPHLVKHLEEQADRLLWHKAEESAAYAMRLLKLADVQNNKAYRALGLMKQGNALITQGDFVGAWDELTASQNLYLELGDNIGWARTCIPMISISPYLSQFDKLLELEPEAAEILIKAKVIPRLIWLKMNKGVAHARLGQFDKSLEAYQQAVDICVEFPHIGENFLGGVYSNMGISYSFLGEFDTAERYLADAIARFENEIFALHSIKINMAIALTASGQLPRALQLSQEIETYHETAADANQHRRLLARMVTLNIYLLLNRYKDAVKIAEATIEEVETLKVSIDKRIFLQLAEAAASISNFDKAQAALVEAEKEFDTPNTQSWLAKVYLLRGQIAFLQEQFDEALDAATKATAIFEQGGMQYDSATSQLLQGQVHLINGDYQEAATLAEKALQFAVRYRVATLQYAAYLLLGKIAQAQDKLADAEQYYRQGLDTIEHAHRRLTITLRTGFMEDKQEAIRLLMQILIDKGEMKSAFEVLERSKSQQWLSYLTDNQRLRWNVEDDAVRQKVEELNQLRTQYYVHQHRLQNALNSEDTMAVPPIPTDNLDAYLEDLERKMHRILDDLYLNPQDSTADMPDVKGYDEIIRHIPADASLIGYYNNGQQIYAFVLNSERNVPECVQLPMSVYDLTDKIGQLERNISRVISIGRMGKRVRILKKQVEKLLSQLFDGIFAPLLHLIKSSRRLYIVPYGDLHTLPFHLLHNKGQYVIQKWQIVILPVAILITREMEATNAGAIVLADTWDGKLSQTLDEAQDVYERFGGELYLCEQATRERLQTQPKLILHIASHGVAELDMPHLSYVQLHGERVYFDDLLQLDLRYELITLSACDTGKARIVPGDDVVGLGRNLIYAGAGAIVTSLWPAPDTVTRLVMQSFYQALDEGMSKSAALQTAQQYILEHQPETHPAFWGAFQLIGDDKPLSQI